MDKKDKKNLNKTGICDLFITPAMVNLNMSDTQGGGIKRMLQTQRRRFFPLPDDDLSNSEFN